MVSVHSTLRTNRPLLDEFDTGRGDGTWVGMRGLGDVFRSVAKTILECVGLLSTGDMPPRRWSVIERGGDPAAPTVGIDAEFSTAVYPVAPPQMTPGRHHAPVSTAHYLGQL